ncbi:hypothetical protein ONE63_002354 [Megalurothrips usitatus]|uniref:CHHC U11-48K-type domain-containing protein n=1 Tax=Megalurothrips usitatus TaxID=439358 RepID=A0AAV7XEL1_9NEOP|nr:hypothetical protein ONE63_002354 [Megalurothrips usitatus]
MAHHNPYVECPYDVAHQVPKLRMQIHLIKCRKNNPHLAKLMKSCPFNATHIMPERELNLHLQCCTDRCLIEGQKYNCKQDHGDLGNPTFHAPIPKETWDDRECEEQSHMVGAHQNQESRPRSPR